MRFGDSITIQLRFLLYWNCVVIDPGRCWRPMKTEIIV
jgi:hypothetical protein